MAAGALQEAVKVNEAGVEAEVEVEMEGGSLHEVEVEEWELAQAVGRHYPFQQSAERIPDLL